ncbi:MAG: protoheme IX farnesyltransferase, partial [Polyangiaceae bacterium]|nr:protoheme IX farnesyltransferase [Polyangiaceae bacterium]
MTTAASTQTLVGTLRDMVALTKPRITMMVVITAAGGMWLASRALGELALSPLRVFGVLATTAMVVGGANALNCYLERESDRHMERTRTRPLPARRLDPRLALYFGIALGLISVPILVVAANPLTGVLGALALLIYVAIYTPMKAVTPTALLVGAVPGALPPLMGWTAVTNSLDVPGLVLFAILFLWQIPHFIAISIFRQEDYERAGLKVLPSVQGLGPAKVQTAFYASLLVPVSLMLFPLHVAGKLYLAVAIVLNIAFVGVSLLGL